MKYSASPDLRNKLLCALPVVACVLAAWPLLEMGVHDDWSYTFTVKRLAETGHLTYNGWAAFPPGAQAYWAALWVRVFGFSFTLVRLTTLPFAAGCGWLLYAMHRRISIGPNLSLLGTLTVVLSPLFLPNAASFMSDVPSLFFFLLAAYGYACAVEAKPADGAADVRERGSADLRLLMLATLAALAGTTIRQSVWLVPLVCLPCGAWLRRGDSRFVIAAGVAWLASVAGELGVLKWYASQPYSVPESIVGHLQSLAYHPLHLLKASVLMTFMPALMILPVLAGSMLSRRALQSLSARSWALIAAVLASGLLFCARSHAWAP